MDFRFDWIEPDILAASSIPTDLPALESLRRQGVRAIVSLTERPIIGMTDITLAAVDKLDMVYLHKPIPDGFSPTIEQSKHIIDQIDQMTQQKRPVLIHCHAGVGRTGTMLHAYYLAYGHNLEQAKIKVRARRPSCAFVILSEQQREFLLDFAAGHPPA